MIALRSRTSRGACDAPHSLRGRLHRRATGVLSRGAAWLVFGGVSIVGTVACAPSETTPVATRPVEGPIDPARLYQRTCAGCHGAGGHGDGPSGAISGAVSLHASAMVRAGDAEALRALIRSGRGAMPPHAWLRDDELAAITTHVITLVRGGDATPGAEAAEAAVPSAEDGQAEGDAADEGPEH